MSGMKDAMVLAARERIRDAAEQMLAALERYMHAAAGVTTNRWLSRCVAGGDDDCVREYKTRCVYCQARAAIAAAKGDA